ncbi:putative Myb-like transcription factor-like protein [Phyllosticta citricarpa]|uniref:Myb-like transcription factor-like protein n=2 Tax=Phyllosticta TaxID=121621 RepID=A0ABR1LH12_9PEZI
MSSQPATIGSTAGTAGGSPTNPRKRRASGAATGTTAQLAPNTATIAPASVTSTGAATTAYTDPAGLGAAGGGGGAAGGDPAVMAEGGAVGGAGAVQPPPPKKGRTNTPWTAAEEQRLKIMRDAGNSWSEIAKTFPTRTEGSVKKHWYKDMHYAEFAEDESAALLAAIKEYEASKWKVIGAKVGKPAKACEQYAKEHFGGKF